MFVSCQSPSLSIKDVYKRRYHFKVNCILYYNNSEKNKCSIKKGIIDLLSIDYTLLKDDMISYEFKNSNKSNRLYIDPIISNIIIEKSMKDRKNDTIKNIILLEYLELFSYENEITILNNFSKIRSPLSINDITLLTILNSNEHKPTSTTNSAINWDITIYDSNLNKSIYINDKKNNLDYIFNKQ
jgi:hypothetical protein